MRETSIGCFSHTPSWGSARSPDLCLDQESDGQPFALQDDAPSTEPHRSGPTQLMLTRAHPKGQSTHPLTGPWPCPEDAEKDTRLRVPGGGRAGPSPPPLSRLHGNGPFHHAEPRPCPAPPGVPSSGALTGCVTLGRRPTLPVPQLFLRKAVRT